MYQSFTPKASGEFAPQRLKSVREKISEMGLSGWILSRTDEYKGEYLAPYAERLQWLSGFSGSAGAGAISLNKAALFIDGRYTAQVKQECDESLFEFCHYIERPLKAWVLEEFADGDKVGFNPEIWSEAQINQLTPALNAKGITLVPLPDLIDSVWKDQPSPPLHPAELYATAYAGESANSKIGRVQQKLTKAKTDMLFVPECDALCWLLNIRGADIIHNPVVHGRLLIPQSGKVIVYMDARKVLQPVRDALEEDVVFKDPSSLVDDLTAYAKEGSCFSLDPHIVSCQIFDILRQNGAKIIKEQSPITLMKAIKNETEINGHRIAQKYDSQAMASFLNWFEENISSGEITEISAAQKLEESRRAQPSLKEISFDTISGFGANGAIVHYRVNTASSATMNGSSLYLVDSGGQYLEGTTDITRTIAIGQPSEDMRKHYTLVLKGHIALACAVFPKGTTGAMLDCLARLPLWQHGLDYDHGTGHGIGAYLNVHEGPQSISRYSKVPLEAGMILSNEPGFYKEGEYGIRLENLILVIEKDFPHVNNKMLGFETLSFTRFDERLIDDTLLNPEEKQWLDNYHKHCPTQ